MFQVFGPKVVPVACDLLYSNSDPNNIIHHMPSSGQCEAKATGFQTESLSCNNDVPRLYDDASADTFVGRFEL